MKSSMCILVYQNELTYTAGVNVWCWIMWNPIIGPFFFNEIFSWVSITLRNERNAWQKTGNGNTEVPQKLAKIAKKFLRSHKVVLIYKYCAKVSWKHILRIFSSHRKDKSSGSITQQFIKCWTGQSEILNPQLVGEFCTRNPLCVIADIRLWLWDDRAQLQRNLRYTWTTPCKNYDISRGG